MFILVKVCVFWATFGTALSEYLLSPEYVYHPYQEEYAPEYNNYEPKDYHFQYAVSDPHTGDHKQQWEVKEKGVVRGMYSLLEPDGTTRVVEYIADDHGFRATVKKLGVATHETTHHGHDGGGVVASLPEAFSNGYHGAYSGLQENYGISTYAVPAELEHKHDTSVEVHGFTGNANDDSSYTDYGHEEDAGANNVAIYYQNDAHNYYPNNYYVVQPEIVPIPYKLPYQYKRQVYGGGARSWVNSHVGY
ncbi:hypothetical protein ILUMI_26735 [Ignelater luminosus]|uniref:Uncharacterized protein n=1 Tax=Ignelater luminosus TaxID=2038154 RepID=A0A8K0FVV3_IGNLU|nr:hypothetical protein ILUMI_26735 [Ignelater luminosus]